MEEGRAREIFGGGAAEFVIGGIGLLARSRGRGRRGSASLHSGWVGRIVDGLAFLEAPSFL